LGTAGLGSYLCKQFICLLGYLEIIEAYEKSAASASLQDHLELSQGSIHVQGLVGSSLSFIIKNAFEKSDKPFLLILNDKEEAAY
jgi:transcription-repair coupling factor (superfamily II helicase)